MAYSKNLYLASLLDMWVGPKPVVVEHVRKQLLRGDEQEEIQQAIEETLRGELDPTCTYVAWLSHSGLDFKNKPPVLRLG